MDETVYPRRCSRWIGCSVNVCPLDPGRARRYIVSEDPERTCLENLRHRLEIVAQAKADGVDLGAGTTRLEQKALDAGAATVDSIIAEFDRKAENRRQRGLELAAAKAAGACKTGAGDEGTAIAG